MFQSTDNMNCGVSAVLAHGIAIFAVTRPNIVSKKQNMQEKNQGVMAQTSIRCL